MNRDAPTASAFSVAAEAPPLLVDAREAARLCGLSRSTFYALHKVGKTPAAVKLLGCTRWRRDELAAWITAGCPARDRWERMRGARA